MSLAIRRLAPGTTNLGGLLASAALVAACTAAGPGASPTAGPTATPAPTSPPASPSATPTTQPTGTASPTATAGGQATVSVASSVHGEHLVDADGLALYVFTNDSAGTTTCFDQCIANWPALTVEQGTSATAGAGVTAQLGTITRSDDGTSQVTINGMPIYYFIGDQAAGDLNGQGIGGVWFLAGPDGAPVGAAPTGSPTSGGSGDTEVPPGGTYGDY